MTVTDVHFPSAYVVVRDRRVLAPPMDAGFVRRKTLSE